MLPLKKFCALFLLLFFLSGLATPVLASGNSCTVSSVSNKVASSANCSATEQCCCCRGDSTCGAAGEKGTCFPTQMVKGREIDPLTKAEVIRFTPVTCSAVVCPFSTHTSVEEFIMAAVNYIFYLSIILAPLMIIIGAAVFLTSAGNPKQTKLGTSIIQWTAIGFAIILFARGITAIIKMILVG
ncbi:MAG: pilin [Candidatus Gribaldobacteria bacterium]|nr:pilin [Candidatus Gribaldobacteria bacterium]